MRPYRAFWMPAMMVALISPPAFFRFPSINPFLTMLEMSPLFMPASRSIASRAAFTPSCTCCSAGSSDRMPTAALRPASLVRSWALASCANSCTVFGVDTPSDANALSSFAALSAAFCAGVVIASYAAPVILLRLSIEPAAATMLVASSALPMLASSADMPTASNTALTPCRLVASVFSVSLDSP